MAVTIDCSKPKDLLKQIPCLACLSESEMKMVLVVVLNDYLTLLRGSEPYSFPEEIGDLMSDSACYSCLSKKQLLQIILLLFGYLAYSSETILPDIIAKGKCLPCATPGQVDSAIMHLLCQIVYQTAQQ